jgi:hypothetical protein
MAEAFKVGDLVIYNANCEATSQCPYCGLVEILSIDLNVYRCIVQILNTGARYGDTLSHCQLAHLHRITKVNANST